MATANLLSDDLLLPERSVKNAHPTDSSRVLLGLMNLSRKAEEAESTGSNAAMLDGVISKAVLRSLLSALHFRDVATVRHSRRTANLAVGMATYLGWEGRQLKLLEVAALLHDIGKIGVPDNILFKPGELGPDEAALMALHYNIGVDVLQACRVDQEVLQIVNQSHSHYNGSTDDFRRIGSDVHFGARILAVADAYDSLATEQVYRESKSHDEIIQILGGASGTQFDGNVVAALERWIDRDGAPYASDQSDSAKKGQSRGPAQLEDAMEASALCHIFSYLYLLESLYDGFFLVDADLRVVVWNHGVEKLLGRPSHEMLNNVWTSKLLAYSNIYGEEVPQEERPLNIAISTGKPATLQLQIQHQSFQ